MRHKKLWVLAGVCTLLVVFVVAVSGKVSHPVKGEWSTAEVKGSKLWVEPVTDFIDTVPVNAKNPVSGQVLKFNGTAWVPAADDTGGGPGTNYWTLSGNSLYPNDLGWNVGVGVVPNYKFHVRATASGAPAIYGENTYSGSSHGYGVYGKSVNQDYYGYGGYFVGGYYGVYGKVEPTGAHTYCGVGGNVSGGTGNNLGVYGYISGGGQFSSGIYGHSATANTPGIVAHGGNATATYFPPSGSDAGGMATGRDFGWYGVAQAGNGQGLIGLGSGIDTVVIISGGVGVQGRGKGYGVYGNNPSSNTDNNSAIAIYGYSNPTITTYAQTALVGDCGADDVANRYGVYCKGKFYATGTKSTSIKTDDGERLLYCMESPEVWFEDVGSGRLENGSATIEIDPIFLQGVTIDANHPMHVFIQLEGECPGGVWVEKGTHSFTVHQQGEGTSNAPFSYRILAKRKGNENERLEKLLPLKVEEPTTVKIRKGPELESRGE